MRLRRPSARWHICAALALLSVVATFVPGGRASLEWQRAALEGGQWLRLLSGHLAHLDTQHLLFNLLGLLLVAELLLERWRTAAIVSLGIVSALGTSVMLWFWEPDLQWYTGLSGLLHGLWAGAALTGWQRRGGLLPQAALAALVVKLAWLDPATALVTIVPVMPAPAGMGILPAIPPIPVVSVAHLYGALSGLAWAGLNHAWRRLRHLD